MVGGEAGQCPGQWMCPLAGAFFAGKINRRFWEEKRKAAKGQEGTGAFGPPPLPGDGGSSPAWRPRALPLRRRRNAALCASKSCRLSGRRPYAPPILVLRRSGCRPSFDLPEISPGEGDGGAPLSSAGLCPPYPSRSNTGSAAEIPPEGFPLRLTGAYCRREGGNPSI